MELSETKALILTMVRGIVSLPDEVELRVSEESDDKGEYTQVNIKVAKVDIPKAIGQKGATADAIRRIAVLSAIREGYSKMLFLRVDAPHMPKNVFYETPTTA
jgi:predicted RNA-binding protein YlqC (UPF0109 family)